MKRFLFGLISILSLEICFATENSERATAKINSSCTSAIKDFVSQFESDQDLVPFLQKTVQIGRPAIQFLKQKQVNLNAKLKIEMKGDRSIVIMPAKRNPGSKQELLVELAADCSTGKFTISGTDFKIQNDISFIENFASVLRGHDKQEHHKKSASVDMRWISLLLPAARAAHPIIWSCMASWLDPLEWPTHNVGFCRDVLFCNDGHDSERLADMVHSSVAVATALPMYAVRWSEAALKPSCHDQIQELKKILPKNLEMRTDDRGLITDANLGSDYSIYFKDKVTGKERVFSSDFDTGILYENPEHNGRGSDRPTGNLGVIKYNSSGEVKEIRKDCERSNWLKSGPEFEKQKSDVQPFVKIFSYIGKNLAFLKCDLSTGVSPGSGGSPGNR